ncbi:hypothetical protein ACMSD4_12175 [Bacteroides thetaiotaomicron]|jgi:hypothetical protein|uniref:hypothetical protein n=1 Tax=Bacteroides thetaiotaomicron TaxID=818 RepID=UPI0039C04C17
MEKEDVKKQLEHNFNAALECLGVKSSIGIIYEYNPIRFNSNSNAAECNNINLYINEAWIDMLIAKNDFYDVKYMMYHEARHIYQEQIIKDYKERGKSCELPATIKAWIKNFDNYKRNTGEESVDANADQVVEIDANAFAIVLLQMQKITTIRLNPNTEKETIVLAQKLGKKYGDKLDEWVKILS